MGAQSLKKIVRKIHLWLGLTSGLVVFIVALTGCLYVFQEEISLLLQSGVFRNVEPRDQPFISPMTIKSKVEQAFEGNITYMNATVFPQGDRASIIWVRDNTREYTAFLVDPYSGEIIDSYPYRITFWAVVLALHTSLLIPEYGHHIVAIATLIFVIMLISGLFLWFPKSKRGYKQRFRIKWGASGKRLNYDLHNVFGFYMTWVAIFLAITGLVWSYSWVDTGIYWLASGGKNPEKQETVNSITAGWELPASTNKIDATLQEIIYLQPSLSQYHLVYAIDSAAAHSLTLNTEVGKFYNRHDLYYFDQYTGETLQTNLWKDKNGGDILQAANYNIHVGAILGLPGKVLAFFASLIATSLPVTGFIIWRGRGSTNRKKRRRKSRGKANTKKLHSRPLPAN